MNKLIHTLLYKLLPLSTYLRVMSWALFASIRLGFGRYSTATEYIFHLRKLVGEGDVAIDIGANLGYYSRPISHIIGEQGQLYCVEPVAVIFDVLRRNLKGCSNVELHNVALGTQSCEVTMSNDSVGEDGYFATGQTGVGEGCCEGAVEFTAHMVCGSELFGGLDKLDFVKCDIEGFEVVVLPEMREIIERHKPTVLVESGGERRAEIYKLFSEMGYTAYTLIRGKEVEYDPRNDNHKDLIFRCV